MAIVLVSAIFTQAAHFCLIDIVMTAPELIVEEFPATLKTVAVSVNLVGMAVCVRKLLFKATTPETSRLWQTENQG